MKSLVSLWLLLAATPVLAAQQHPVPEEFIGEWVPVGSTCNASSRLRVEDNTVTLVNGADLEQFGDLDLCFSCEGGARYNGMVLWLMPESKRSKKGQAPFIVKFNAKEEQGITVVEIVRDNLKKRFPFHNTKLYKCQNKHK